MRENIIKIYWQAMDANGKVYLYNTEKPKLNDVRGSYIVSYNYTADFLFPIQLKPLQIAEITVSENGTWSYEIEREEGWYVAKEKHSGFVFLSNNYGGEWKNQSGVKIHLGLCTISSTRIPDECII